MRLPANQTENLWRHYWARVMREVGGESLLPTLPLDHWGPLPNGPLANGDGVAVANGWGGGPPEPPQETPVASEVLPELDEPPDLPAPNRRLRRTIKRELRRGPRVAKASRPPKPAGEAAPPALPARRAEYEPDPNRFYAEGWVGDLWYTIEDLFDCIDDYFVWLKRMRKWLPDYYRLYSRIGGVIIPSKGWFYIKKPPHVPDPHKWPAFIMLSFPNKWGETPEDERKPDDPPDPPDGWGVKVLAFHKMHRARGDYVVPAGCMIYQGVILYASRRKGSPTWPLGFYIAVHETGKVECVRQVVARGQKLPRRGKQDPATVWHKTIDYPPELKEICDETSKRRREKGDETAPKTVDEWVALCFFTGVNETLAADTGVQVSIARGDIVGRFGVPLERTGYFFCDREFTGRRRRPIYHLVGEYSYTRNGKTITVPEHRRGLTERLFSWHGYRVCITEAGRHHPGLATFNLASHDEDELEHPRDGIGMTALGKVLREGIWQAPDRERWSAPRFGLPRGRA